MKKPGRPRGPAAKRPALMLYSGDWLKDPALGMCEPATRGIWIDLLMAMHEARESGELVGTPEGLARVSRCTAPALLAALDDLWITGAAEVFLLLADGRAVPLSAPPSRYCPRFVPGIVPDLSPQNGAEKGGISADLSPAIPARFVVQNRRMRRAAAEREKQRLKKGAQRGAGGDEGGAGAIVPGLSPGRSSYSPSGIRDHLSGDHGDAGDQGDLSLDLPGTGAPPGDTAPTDPAPGAAPTPAVLDSPTDGLNPAEVVIWREGVRVLMKTGQTEPAARAYLGRLCRDHGEANTAEAIGLLLLRPVADPRSWLSKFLIQRSNPTTTAGQGKLHRAAQALEAFNHDQINRARVTGNGATGALEDAREEPRQRASGE